MGSVELFEPASVVAGVGVGAGGVVVGAGATVGEGTASSGAWI